MADVKITALKNRPYRVQGPVDLFDDTTAVTPPATPVFLCCCGASSNKPFCNGTHSRIGFQAAADAVPDSQEP